MDVKWFAQTNMRYIESFSQVLSENTDLYFCGNRPGDNDTSAPVIVSITNEAVLQWYVAVFKAGINECVGVTFDVADDQVAVLMESNGLYTGTSQHLLALFLSRDGVYQSGFSITQGSLAIDMHLASQIIHLVEEHTFLFAG